MIVTYKTHFECDDWIGFGGVRKTNGRPRSGDGPLHAKGSFAKFEDLAKIAFR